MSERADVACCGLTVAQAAALEALQAEGPLRLGALGRRLGITPSTLSRNLLRLESAGLVERKADASDARSARVGLTPSGRDAARAVAAQEEGFARQVIGRIPVERRGPVIDALADLLEAVRAATEECCPGAFGHLMEGVEEAGTGVGGEGDGPACGCGPGREGRKGRSR